MAIPCLNSVFERIPVSAFPHVVHGEVIEIPSDASILDAVKVLAINNILSAPVRNVTAPTNASWIDNYLGIVEFAGIILWLLEQTRKSVATSEALGKAGSLTSDDLRLRSFVEELTTSNSYCRGQVKEIAGSFRWAPFLPVQKSDTLLTVLLLLSKYQIKSIPVVEAGKGEVLNFITQSGVIHVLSKCSGMQWFDALANLSLSEVGLPLMSADKVIKVEDDQLLLDAFELMKEHRIGGVPVVHRGERQPIASISVRDVRLLLTIPNIYSCSKLKVEDFLEATKAYMRVNDPCSQHLKQVVTCGASSKLKDVILKLDESRIHRIYIVDEDKNLHGVVTLRDIISKFVTEPSGYFGDFL